MQGRGAAAAAPHARGLPSGAARAPRGVGVGGCERALRQLTRATGGVAWPAGLVLPNHSFCAPAPASDLPQPCGPCHPTSTPGQVPWHLWASPAPGRLPLQRCSTSFAFPLCHALACAAAEQAAATLAAHRETCRPGPLVPPAHATRALLAPPPVPLNLLPAAQAGMCVPVRVWRVCAALAIAPSCAPSHAQAGPAPRALPCHSADAPGVMPVLVLQSPPLKEASFPSRQCKIGPAECRSSALVALRRRRRAEAARWVPAGGAVRRCATRAPGVPKELAAAEHSTWSYPPSSR